MLKQFSNLAFTVNRLRTGFLPLAGIRNFTNSNPIFSASGTAVDSSSSVSIPSYVIEELSAPKQTKVLRRAEAVVKSVRGHTKKLNPIARQLKNLSVNEAMAQMAFSPSSRGSYATTALKRAVRQAEIYHNLPQSQLMVEAAWTGKHLSSPRIRHHSKGRAGRSHKRTSMLSIRLREMTTEEAIKKNKFRKTLPTLESISSLSPRGY